MAWPLAQLVWERPEGALFLLVPLALLIFARRPGRAPVRPTGTLGLWRVVAESEETASKSRRRIPPFLWLAIASLVSGTAALSGPRLEREKEPTTWLVVVDRSPSMGLSSGLGEDGETRLSRGVRLAGEWLGETAEPGDRVRWLSRGREEVTLAVGDLPPVEWLALPATPLPEPAWERHDEPGCLWISDAPRADPGQAALIATGARAVPGPVASRGAKGGEELLVWTAEDELVPSPSAMQRVIVVPRTDLPAVLERMLTSYGQSRGWERVAEASPAAVAFRFVTPAGAVAGESVEGPVGRDGWQSRVEADLPRDDVDAAGEKPGMRTWLALESGAEEHRVVGFGPGLIECYLTALEEPRGDPAAFAVSWSKLFDSVALPFPGVVPLEERKVVGAPRTLSGVGPPTPKDVSDGHLDGPPLTSWLASLASLLAALAALVGFSRPRRQR